MGMLPTYAVYQASFSVFLLTSASAIKSSHTRGTAMAIPIDNRGIRLKLRIVTRIGDEPTIMGIGSAGGSRGRGLYMALLPDSRGDSSGQARVLRHPTVGSVPRA
ncbi:hypothetical protein B0T26DRAFT_715717 [Lasiosphaeria miniovina]|uniref:Uncharacterized protein n=1 Tax=Lasiosphaeria miniovina TaxID=1954250 RepID=A0AA40ABP0_9PEZI|nr:uncharacterized protein B0T26DRAFT_715717 [Lasiosphaeria miniovina]KAK0712934.1 hypothetical protein B0T26DRAFT_715717 [Lasiosphaeria miniovina]